MSETGTAVDIMQPTEDSRTEDNTTFEAGTESVAVEANSNNGDDGRSSADSNAQILFFQFRSIVLMSQITAS